MIIKVEDAVQEIQGAIQEFADIAVLGMSGGADSTLVAVLCQQALGQKNVFPIYMPDYLKRNKNDRVYNTADYLGLKLEAYSVRDIAEFIMKRTIDFQYHIGKDKMIEGNLKARIRMCMLYLRANTVSLLSDDDKRVRVIGTGNLDELTLGYFTKYGDGGVDMLPIGNLHKTEIYQMLDWFRDKGLITHDMIDRVPSAELYEGQTDEEELGFSYREIERMFEEKIALTDSIATRVNNNTHKCKTPPIITLRQFCEKGESK
jgi:NAD+ synthase